MSGVMTDFRGTGVLDTRRPAKACGHDSPEIERSDSTPRLRSAWSQMSRVSLTGACARRRLMESASRRGGGKEHERSEISGMRSREADGQRARAVAATSQRSRTLRWGTPEIG